MKVRQRLPRDVPVASRFECAAATGGPMIPEHRPGASPVGAEVHLHHLRGGVAAHHHVKEHLIVGGVDQLPVVQERHIDAPGVVGVGMYHPVLAAAETVERVQPADRARTGSPPHSSKGLTRRRPSRGCARRPPATPRSRRALVVAPLRLPPLSSAQFSRSSSVPDQNPAASPAAYAAPRAVVSATTGRTRGRRGCRPGSACQIVGCDPPSTLMTSSGDARSAAMRRRRRGTGSRWPRAWRGPDGRWC